MTSTQQAYPWGQVSPSGAMHIVPYWEPPTHVVPYWEHPTHVVWPWGDPFPYEYRWPYWPPYYVPPYRNPAVPELRFCPYCGRQMGHGYTTTEIAWDGTTTTTNTTDGIAWGCGGSSAERPACDCEKGREEPTQ